MQTDSYPLFKAYTLPTSFVALAVKSKQKDFMSSHLWIACLLVFVKVALCKSYFCPSCSGSEIHSKNSEFNENFYSVHTQIWITLIKSAWLVRRSRKYNTTGTWPLFTSGSQKWGRFEIPCGWDLKCEWLPQKMRVTPAKCGCVTWQVCYLAWNTTLSCSKSY